MTKIISLPVDDNLRGPAQPGEVRLGPVFVGRLLLAQDQISRAWVSAWGSGTHAQVVMRDGSTQYVYSPAAPSVVEALLTA